MRMLWRWRWTVGLIVLAAITQAWGVLLAIGGVWMADSYRNWEDDWAAWEAAR